MAQLSKLQIRAKVLSVISEIKSLNSYGEALLRRFVENLSEIEDRQFLFDVFIKEFIKMSENEYIFSACLIKELVPSDYVQDKVFEQLGSNSYSDETKYKLVQLLRFIGSNAPYDAIPQYFDNPQEVLDMETQKLLESAVVNPEAMLDFLDFVYAVPENDKNILVSSLTQDYKGDKLANIIYPILYADFDDKLKLLIIEVLSESKSSLAIEPLVYLSQISNNSAIVNACNIGLKKLKLSGATAEKADEYFSNAVQNFIPAQFYTTIPDGSGNQALLISRVNEQGKYVFVAVVINDIYGIVDCFGFYNISKSEFEKIVNKFYKSEGNYKVSPEYIKSRLNDAYALSLENKNVLPYEYICWSVFFRDLKPLAKPLREIVDDTVEKINVPKDEVLNILTKDYTQRWFINKEGNSVLADVLEKIYNSELLDKEIISDFHHCALAAFDENIWRQRILNLVYLLNENSKSKEAVIFNALLNNESLFNLFKSVIIQRSIFTYFMVLKENQNESLFTVNIFKKKNMANTSYDTKKIDNIIVILKKCWINE